LITKENLDKFIADLQKDIDELDKKTKDQAEASLTAAFDGFRHRLTERIAQQKSAAEESRRIGDDAGARHHEALVEIYKSLFNIGERPSVSDGQ
jgi:hypothetical protein